MKILILLLIHVVTFAQKNLQYENGVVMTIDEVDSGKYKLSSTFVECGTFNITDSFVTHTIDGQESIKYIIDRKEYEQECQCVYYTCSYLNDVRVIRINDTQHTLSMGGFYDTGFLVYIYFLKTPK